MPLLTAAVTVLGLTGTPGLPGGPYDHSQTAAARTYSSAFTRLHATGPGKPYGSFAGKSSATADIKYVADSIRVYVSEGDISEIDLEVLEVMVPRVADSTYVFQAKTVSDTVAPRIADIVQFLNKSGTTAKTVSDTIRAYVTESSSYRVAVGVADTVTPVVTEGKTVQKDNAINVSDTITVVLTERTFLQQSQATRSFDVTDVITPVIAESPGLKQAGEVDSIRIVDSPYGVIRFSEI